MTVRLVKGAYWDYETVLSQQRNWPAPVFARKAESDASFEDLSRLLLENHDAVDAALGTHNVRSIAHALAQAERLGVDRRNLEFQMLYGMAEPIKTALLQMNCRVREYCPVGELLPGIAYFVRRLLENTSNEGFLANKFAKGASREGLLDDPRQLLRARRPSTGCGPGSRGPAATVLCRLKPAVPGGFRNEPHTDFTRAAEREKIQRRPSRLAPKPGPAPPAHH